MEVSTVVNSNPQASNNNNNNSNNNNNNNNTTSLIHNNDDNLQSHHLIINSKMNVSSTKNNCPNIINNNGNDQTTFNNSLTATKNKITINNVQHSPNINSIEHQNQVSNNSREVLKLDQVELDVSVIINKLLKKIEEENLSKVTANNNNANLPHGLPFQSNNVSTSVQEQICSSSNRDTDSSLDSSQLDQRSQDLSPDDASCDLVIDSNLPSDDMQEPSIQSEQQLQQHHLLQQEENFSQGDQKQTSGTSKVPPETIDTSTTSKTTIGDIGEPNCTQNAPKQDSKFVQDVTDVEMYTSSHVQNDAPKLISNTDRSQEERKQNNPEVIPGTLKQQPVLNASSKDSIEEVAKLDCIVSEITKVDDLTEVHEDKTKDMVTLKNLEISPPPPAEGAEKITNQDKVEEEISLTKSTNKVQKNKRKRNDNSGPTPERCESTESGRSKRQRTQTKLFQAGDGKSYREQTSISSSNRRQSTRPAARNRKKSTTSSNSDANLSIAQDNIIQEPTNDLQDVIFYEKNDYLAIRNEENSFYLCQLAENVRVKRPLLRVKWLDTRDGGQTYFLTSHYDKVPRKSIISPVLLNKLKSEKKGEQTFTLNDSDKSNIEERLKRSLNAQTECGSSQETITDN